ncbi:MAG: nitroreductase [Dehalococcoidia bacterium]|nr:nitroreductase [Dehalococcoidia bacterium]
MAQDLFEIMHSMRAMRRLKPDPVPDDVVRQILRAAIGAPNGGNRQRWRFLVVTDPEVKSQVQVYYQRAFEDHVRDAYLHGEAPPGMTKEQHLRQLGAVEYLTVHFHEAPVWIVPCMEGGETPRRAEGAGIYPAVQNMLLAARALGLGATLTTRHTNYQREVDEIFALPEGVHSYAILPIGYPMGNFGPTRRGSLADVVDGSRWGEPAPFDLGDGA